MRLPSAINKASASAEVDDPCAVITGRVTARFISSQPVTANCFTHIPGSARGLAHSLLFMRRTRSFVGLRLKVTYLFYPHGSHIHYETVLEKSRFF